MKLFTSESVTAGHPDKICDRISDTILDECLKQDKNSRVACETFCTTGLVVVGGEITTNAYVNINDIVRNTLVDIGYDNPDYGIDGRNCGIITTIEEQSPDIALGTNDDIGGAGDQGICFGYACKETPELMPLPITLAHKFAKQLEHARKHFTECKEAFRPDGKTQVTIGYNTVGEPELIDTLLISTQHSPDYTQNDIAELVKKFVINLIPDSNDEYIHRLIKDETKILINPTGRFVIGGPQGDTGLTGRKIIVDTYGGYGRHGGGAFSGKDPTKVDRSGAYMARFLAKNILASPAINASKVSVQLGYAIGVPEPVSLTVETNDTRLGIDRRIEKIIRKYIDLTPKGIISRFNMLNPIYSQFSAYGHIGREDIMPGWEMTNLKKLFEF